MAQWEKEETELKVPGGSPLCANNCGLPGNSATKNMCQPCFTAHMDLASSSSSSPSVPSFKPRSEAVRLEAADTRREEYDGIGITREGAGAEVPAVVEEKSAVSRCGGCRRKVGLTGFRCRCGGLFCADHRYSDRHGCRYDYKAEARERIARENPVYKAAKIVRI